jgi:hypothetical protein
MRDEDALRAPELTLVNRVTLNGLRYEIDLNLRATAAARRQTYRHRRSPAVWSPIEIGGARGWRTGYVVPVMSGLLNGELDIDGERISFDRGSGYHDHNWGFWKGVSWQWGQVQEGDLSVIFGRVFPPREAADPDRIPGFIGALGPDGPLGYATDVTISEENDERGQPRTITIAGRSPLIDIHLRFDVGSVVMTRMAQGPIANGVNFLQMRGQYTVTGQAGDVCRFQGYGIGGDLPGKSQTQIPNPKSHDLNIRRPKCTKDSLFFVCFETFVVD